MAAALIGIGLSATGVVLAGDITSSADSLNVSGATNGVDFDYRHQPVREQWTALRRKLLGHFAYFGITGNYQALHNFSVRVIEMWRKWLSRRSQRAWISIERMKRLLEHYPLPTPRLRTSPVT